MFVIVGIDLKDVRQMAFHIAQVNVARFMDSVGDDGVAAFVAELDGINAIADASPGFVWRLQDESGNATAINAGDDPRVIVNLSVWESADALFNFVYRSGHTNIMGRRKEWFGKMATAHMAMWWIPAGSVPSVAEAMARLAQLEENGPSREAFTFKTRFAAPQPQLEAVETT